MKYFNEGLFAAQLAILCFCMVFEVWKQILFYCIIYSIKQKLNNIIIIMSYNRYNQ